MDQAIVPSGGALARAEETSIPESLPKEAGLFLLLIGIGGVMLPGPIGAPFIILGGAVFFPKVFRKLDSGIQKRFPKSHRQGMKQVHRFVDDLERRYPSHA
jgi:hypothetical protein